METQIETPKPPEPAITEKPLFPISPQPAVPRLGEHMKAIAGMLHKVGPLPQEEINRRAQREAELASSDKRDRALALWGQAKIPKRYQAADIENLIAGVPKEYREVAMTLRSLVDEPALMALVGPNGTGKTYMACGLARVFCRNQKSALYCRAIDFFMDLKATFGAAAKKNLKDVEAEYRKPELLIIDEMGVRSDTAWEDVALTSVIDARYANEKCTLLIDNRTRDELTERLGARLSDRFKDNDGCCISCDWPSLRGTFTATGA